MKAHYSSEEHSLVSFGFLEISSIFTVQGGSSVDQYYLTQYCVLLNPPPPPPHGKDRHSHGSPEEHHRWFFLGYYKIFVWMIRKNEGEAVFMYSIVLFDLIDIFIRCSTIYVIPAHVSINVS